MSTDGAASKDINNPFLRLKSRYLVFATALAVNLVVTLPFLAISEAGFLPNGVDPAVTTMLDMGVRGAIAAIILWVISSEGVVLKHLFGAKLPRLSILYGACLVFSLLIFSLGSFSIFFYLASSAFPDYATQILENASVLEDATSQFPYVYRGLMLLLVVVLAPVVEEFIFRGVLLQRWAMKWGLRKALVASSVLFGLLHPNNPVGLTLFGLAMGLLYVRSRSLWVPIVCHGLNNLAAVGISRLGKVTGSENVPVTVEEMQTGWKIGLLLVIISVPFLWRFVRQSWPRRQTSIPYLINFGKVEDAKSASDNIL